MLNALNTDAHNRYTLIIHFASPEQYQNRTIPFPCAKPQISLFLNTKSYLFVNQGCLRIWVGWYTCLRVSAGGCQQPPQLNILLSKRPNRHPTFMRLFISLWGWLSWPWHNKMTNEIFLTLKLSSCSGVRFPKVSLDKYGRKFHWPLLVTTKLATIAFGKRTPDLIQNVPWQTQGLIFQTQTFVHGNCVTKCFPTFYTNKKRNFINDKHFIRKAHFIEYNFFNSTL